MGGGGGGGGGGVTDDLQKKNTYLGVPFGKRDQNALVINTADKKSSHLLGLF